MNSDRSKQSENTPTDASKEESAIKRDDKLEVGELGALLRQVRATGAPGGAAKYRNPADFVLREGEIFRLEALTQGELDAVCKGIGRKTLTRKACFNNAQRVVLADKTGSLDYVEGYVTGGIHHAWVATGRKVVDVTYLSKEELTNAKGRTERRAYIGVRFAREYVVGTRARTSVTTLIDDWEGGWPLLHDTVGDWRPRPPGKTIPRRRRG